MKIRKLIALALAVLTLTVAFAPNALATITYAPVNWSQWPLQKQNSYSTRYAYAINRFLRCYFCNTQISTLVTGSETAASVLTRYQNLVNSNYQVIGNFTGDTEYFVKRYQGFTGITVDGKVGTITWGTMRSKVRYDYDDTYNFYYYVEAKDSYNPQYGCLDGQDSSETSFKFAQSERWLVNRIANGTYNYIYS